MKNIFCLAACTIACTLFTYGISLPKDVFSLADLDQAKALAAQKSQPLVFVVTELDTDCPLCKSANKDIFRNFGKIGILILVNNNEMEIRSAPRTFFYMYQNPAVRGGIPITLVTTADASKPIKSIPYREVKDGKASQAAEALIKELEGKNVLGENGTPDDTETPAKNQEPVATPQEWVNSEGRKITASVKEVHADKVVFVMPNGKEVAYPLSQLSTESRDAITKIKKD